MQIYINVYLCVYSVDHGGEIMMTAGLRKCRNINTHTHTHTHTQTHRLLFDCITDLIS